MKKGKYTFYVYSFGILYPHTVTVYIVAETAKRYTIRIPCAIGKHAPGDTMAVAKKSVKFDDEKPKANTQPKQEHDYSNAFWNK